MAFGINVERLIVAARSLTGSHASEDSRSCGVTASPFAALTVLEGPMAALETSPSCRTKVNFQISDRSA